ncbi:hypothetical protein [Bradyrhizobium vignae]|uniref:Uncharacterized protein n=1 Tax=Bradyrhizobium vignae TaxID=1549949 RepID=A0A2U3PUT1_9BRAD|nr:hypothetical protein [Bradyrhizobium vignae]SPP92921.1 protein of unknown function [Bradyrhizobium vignae]
MLAEIQWVISRFFEGQPLKIGETHSVYFCPWFGSAVVVENDREMDKEKFAREAQISQERRLKAPLRLVYSR